MACFSMAALENLLIWAVLLIALILILKLVVGAVAGAIGIGIPPWVMQALKIVIGAALAILVIIVVFWLISCIAGGLPRLR